MTDATLEIQQVQHMLSRERLSVDEPGEGRTCFLSHLGAISKLVPGPWIAHRDLLYALALSNLAPSQRTSLARAVMVEHGREFGVGRLRLQTVPSGLPFGGSSLVMEPRSGGPTCLYTWALGVAPGTATCEWLLLRAQPGWARHEAPPVLRVESLETLAALGGDVVVLVEGATSARQISDLCGGRVELAAHPRFAPHLEGLNPEGQVVLWPHDGLGSAGLRRRKLAAVVLVDGPEPVRQATEAWLRASASRAELAAASCPGRVGRDELERFWRSCGGPRVLLRGDAQWAHEAEEWLKSTGADVHVQGEATQLGLF